MKEVERDIGDELIDVILDCRPYFVVVISGLPVELNIFKEVDDCQLAQHLLLARAGGTSACLWTCLLVAICSEGSDKAWPTKTSPDAS